MKFGVNQNVTHNGEVYHIQTEDGGAANPVITTSVFKQGVVVASRKTAYADVLTSAHKDNIVRDIMREQHKAMFHDLKTGRIERQAQEPRQPPPALQQAQAQPQAQLVEKSIDDIISDFISLDDKATKD